MVQNIRIIEIKKLAVYPRKANKSVVKRYAQAMKAGHFFPPIVVAELDVDGLLSRVLVDGQQRIFAAVRNGDEYIQAETLYLKTEDEVYIEAVKLNSAHGMPFTLLERAEIMMKLRDRMKLDLDEISKILNIPSDEITFVKDVEKLLSTRERLAEGSEKHAGCSSKGDKGRVFSCLIRRCKELRKLLDACELNSTFASKRIIAGDVLRELKKTRVAINFVLADKKTVKP